MINAPVYLDYNAAEPVCKDAMQYVFDNITKFYNPSSYYQWAKENASMIELCRRRIAEHLNCKPEEIYFTSGCSESNALAINGMPADTVVICSEVEHSSILYNPRITDTAPVTKYGQVDLDALKAKVEKYKSASSLLVSIQHANNEVGAINDPKAVRNAIGDKPILMVDAAQTFGKIQIDVIDAGIDILTGSAGKMGGIRGVGFIYINEGLNLEPIIYGTQEQGLRGGTYFDLGIGAFFHAIENINYHKQAPIKSKRNYLIEKMMDIPQVHLVGRRQDRLANNTFFTIDGLNVDSVQLVSLFDLYGYMVSAGSACHAGDPELSHVLKAMGYTPETAKACIRVSIGDETTVEQINCFVETVKLIIKLHKEEADV